MMISAVGGLLLLQHGGPQGIVELRAGAGGLLLLPLACIRPPFLKERSDNLTYPAILSIGKGINQSLKTCFFSNKKDQIGLFCYKKIA